MLSLTTTTMAHVDDDDDDTADGVGGGGASTVCSAAWRYTMAWCSLPPRRCMSSTVVGGRLLCFGGTQEGQGLGPGGHTPLGLCAELLVVSLPRLRGAMMTEPPPPPPLADGGVARAATATMSSLMPTSPPSPPSPPSPGMACGPRGAGAHVHPLGCCFF
jgi:hypothetical protein